MKRRVVDLDRPKRFAAIRVGASGEGGYFLLAGRGSRTHTVALEREQLALLGERLLVIIDELERRGLLAIDAGLSVASDAPPGGRPPREDFHAGTLTLSWDEDGDRIVIEAFAMDADSGIGEHAPRPDRSSEGGEDDLAADDDPLGPDVLRVRLIPVMAQRFARQACRLAGTP
jgi:uncharacterized repeat protein (TIGR03847 family)